MMGVDKVEAGTLSHKQAVHQTFGLAFVNKPSCGVVCVSRFEVFLFLKAALVALLWGFQD